MIHKEQLKDLIKRVLEKYSVFYGDYFKSKEAFQLVYGTIIYESIRGTYLRQIPKHKFDIKKHAIGFGQCEKGTFDWIISVHGEIIPELQRIEFEELEWNIEYMILFVRLRYLLDSRPIPKTIGEQSKYYKEVYNTSDGSGTSQSYLLYWHKYA